MTTPNPLCSCGHEHLTTRGPCVSYHVCGCRSYRPEPDPPWLIAKRVRELLEAVDACPHTISRATLRRPLPREDVTR